MRYLKRVLLCVLLAVPLMARAESSLPEAPGTNAGQAYGLRAPDASNVQTPASAQLPISATPESIDVQTDSHTFDPGLPFWRPVYYGIGVNTIHLLILSLLWTMMGCFIVALLVFTDCRKSNITYRRFPTTGWGVLPCPPNFKGNDHAVS